MFDVSSLEIVFYFLCLVALGIYFRFGDEILFVIVAFLYSGGINRYNLVMSDEKLTWVRVAYARNIFNLTDELALEALNLYTLGTFVIVVSFALLRYSSASTALPRKFDSKALLTEFLAKQQPFILGLLLVFIAINALFNNLLAATLSAAGGFTASGTSYYLLFSFAISSFIILMFLVFRSQSFSRQPFAKLMYGVLIGVAMSFTLDPTQRFKMVSWVVALGIIMTAHLPKPRRLAVFAGGGFILAIGFSFLGEMRITAGKKKDLTFSERLENAQNRFTSGEDQNMLDGYMMLMQVYPYHLNFAYGMEHVEVLLRPIPRALWPNKPLGAYINKLGLNDNMGGGTVGISPTLYGTFYAEAGATGIIIFGFLYAWGLVRLVRLSETYNSEMRLVIRALAISSIIPLLRGGDLPGIYAFIGMTYWPMFLFIRRYNKFCQKKKAELEYEERIQMLEEQRLQREAQGQIVSPV